MDKRIDPEPFTLIAVVASVTGATLSALNYWKTHHKPLPSALRAKMLRQLDDLSEQLRHVRADAKTLQDIFSRSEYPQGDTLGLGNGALLPPDDFVRYERVSDDVFRRLRQIYKATLRVESLSVRLPSVETSQSTHWIGDALGQIEALLSSRNFTVDKAWSSLLSVLMQLESMVDDQRGQLRR